MPELDERPELFERKSLVRRVQRNSRRVVLEKSEWRGRGLRLLEYTERKLRKDFDAAEGDYTARCALARTLFQLLDTRRAVLGEPLPGVLKPSKNTVLEAWKAQAVPALPAPEPAPVDVVNVEPVVDKEVTG